MNNLRQFPRLLGCWTDGQAHRIRANVWRISNDSLMAVTCVGQEVVEVVDATNLDELLSFLTTEHGAGNMLPANAKGH